MPHGSDDAPNVTVASSSKTFSSVKLVSQDARCYKTLNTFISNRHLLYRRVIFFPSRICIFLLFTIKASPRCPRSLYCWKYSLWRIYVKCIAWIAGVKSCHVKNMSILSMCTGKNAFNIWFHDRPEKVPSRFLHKGKLKHVFIIRKPM